MSDGKYRLKQRLIKVRLLTHNSLSKCAVKVSMVMLEAKA